MFQTSGFYPSPHPSSAGAGRIDLRPVGMGAEPGVTADTIRIGMFGPLTGPVSIYGYPINDGAIAVYKQVNDAGGINGRKIEIVQEDDACDPTKARAAVKKLVSRDDVFMVHGGSCSAATFATRDTFIDEQVPFMLMAATLDKITAPLNHYIFATVPTGTVDGESIIRFVQSMPNVKRIAIVHHTDEWANAKLDAIRKVLSGGTGMTLVADEVLDRNASDATAQVLKVKDAKADVVLFVTYPGESAVFLRDAHKYRFGRSFRRHELGNGFAGPGAARGRVGCHSQRLCRRLPEWPDRQRLDAALCRDGAQVFSGRQNSVAAVLWHVWRLCRGGGAAARRARPDTGEICCGAGDVARPASRPVLLPRHHNATSHQGCPTQQIWTVRDGHILPVGEKWPGGPLR